MSLFMNELYGFQLDTNRWYVVLLVICINGTIFLCGDSFVYAFTWKMSSFILQHFWGLNFFLTLVFLLRNIISYMLNWFIVKI